MKMPVAAGSTSPIERTSGPYDLLIGFAAALVGACLAGVFAGAYWHSAGLLIGPGFWGAYLGALAIAFFARLRRLALGMIAALPIAVPAFFGLAVLSAAYSALS